MIASDIRRLVAVEFSDTFTCGIREENINWLDVQGRIGEAIQASGADFKDLCKFVGLDVSEGDPTAQIARLPKLKTAMAIAGFLGVSMSWLLTGRGQPPAKEQAPTLALGATQGISDTIDSTVLQGNHAGTLIINNGSPQMSEQKRELMRIFDSLCLKKQTKLLSFAYEMEEERRSS